MNRKHAFQRIRKQKKNEKTRIQINIGEILVNDKNKNKKNENHLKIKKFSVFLYTTLQKHPMIILSQNLG